MNVNTHDIVLIVWRDGWFNGHTDTWFNCECINLLRPVLRVTTMCTPDNEPHGLAEL